MADMNDNDIRDAIIQLFIECENCRMYELGIADLAVKAGFPAPKPPFMTINPRLKRVLDGMVLAGQLGVDAARQKFRRRK